MLIGDEFMVVEVCEMDIVFDVVFDNELVDEVMVFV